MDSLPFRLGITVHFYKYNAPKLSLCVSDVVYISQATKNPAATQLPSEVTERVQRQRGTEERHAGTKKQARIGRQILRHFRLITNTHDSSGASLHAIANLLRLQCNACSNG